MSGYDKWKLRSPEDERYFVHDNYDEDEDPEEIRLHEEYDRGYNAGFMAGWDAAIRPTRQERIRAAVRSFFQRRRKPMTTDEVPF